MPAPNFVVIGAQRCGTTWLYECLREHPQIFMPVNKEVHFFDTFYERGWDWYMEQFEGSDLAIAVGEATPSYMYKTEVRDRIHLHLPHVRLIALVRNPVDQVWSKYWRARSRGVTSSSLERAMEEIPLFVEQALYGQQLEMFAERFARDQMGVFLYEDMVLDPRAFLSEVFAFLEVDRSFVPSVLGHRVNAAHRARSEHFTRIAVVIRRSLKQYGMQPLLDLGRRMGVQDLVLRLSTNNKKGLPRLEPALRRTLFDRYFREDAERLGAFIGRDLSRWSDLAEIQGSG